MAERLVLGTAGHIDHGKTSLVRALTGVDTDRLPQEKARGITIELGFAPLELPGGARLGVVDVPGHEALVRTMVAGATGIDLVLLVVAADEGVMPQTREHVAICELLGVGRGVVALTKVDLAGPEVTGLAGEEVRELLASTALRDAPQVAVSATTGEGVEALREALAAEAAAAPARTPRAGPPRLSVDRAFEMRGFGAVVTGTLQGGALARGDTVVLLPGGPEARVRGLQSFGEAVERVEPGARCAVNLQGAPLAALSRGMVLTHPGAVRETRALDVELTWLTEAAPLEEAAAVELLAGTAERRARVAPIGGTIAAGGRGFARLHVEGDPVALLPGDRVVLRGFARTSTGGTTLGGGRVLDVAPPRRRRSDPGLRAELEQLADGGDDVQLGVRVERAGFAGAEEAALVAETGLPRPRVAALLAAAGRHGTLVSTRPGRWLPRPALDALRDRLVEALAAFHAEQPLRPGMPRAALRGALPENSAEGAFETLVRGLAAEGRVIEHEDRVALADHRPLLDQRQEAIAAHLRATAMAAVLEPPTLAELEGELRVDEAELRDLLAWLEREGSLTRAPGDLWFDRGAVDDLRVRVLAHLREHGELPTRAYKDLIGTTRKWAVPLMELFDNEHLTIRRGDTRYPRRS